MIKNFDSLSARTKMQVQSLILKADNAIALLDSVDETVDNLSSTIETSANEAQESFETLTEQIAIAEDNLSIQQEAARESMNGLMQQVQQTGDRIQATLDNAFTHFEELQAQQQEFYTKLSEVHSDLNSNLQTIVDQCGETVTNIDSSLGNFNRGSVQFANAIQKLLESCGTRQSTLAQSLSGFSVTMSRSIQAIDETTDSLATRVSTKVTAVEKPLQTLFEQSIEPESDQFVAVVANLEEEVLEVENTILELVDDGLSVGEILTKNTEKVLERDQEIRDCLEEIKPIFEVSENFIV